MSQWIRRDTSLLQARVQELADKHGGLNAAARALSIDPGYLSRMRSGEKTDPGPVALRKLGLREVTFFERIEQE